MDRVKQVRLARGLPLDELANAMAGIVTKQALSKTERGLSMPGPSVLNRFAEALHVKAMHFWAEARATVRFIAYRRHSALP
jgi:transcriptional regulator with XRE-family HTH domain